MILKPNPTPEEIVAAIEDRKTKWQRVQGLQDALTGDHEKPHAVIEGLLMEQSATLVSAQPHNVKSLSWLNACIEAPATHKVFGHFDAKTVDRTLFIETEDPEWLVRERIRGLANGLGLSAEDVPGFKYICPGPFNLVEEARHVAGVLSEYRPNLTVVSTLQNCLGKESLRDDEGMRPTMAAVIQLSRISPIVLLTHSPWNRKQRRAIGTITQVANFMTTLHYEKVTCRNETLIKVWADNKAIGSDPTFTLKVVSDGDTSDPSSVRRVVYLKSGFPKGTGRNAIKEAIQENPDASNEEIADMVGTSSRYVREVRSGAR